MKQLSDYVGTFSLDEVNLDDYPLMGGDLDADAVSSIRTSAASGDLVIHAVIAMWCPDCRRDFPRLVAIADQTGIPRSAIRGYSVDRSKTNPPEVARFAATRIPTFIFEKGGVEVGRYIEQPRGSSLEADVASILKA